METKKAKACKMHDAGYNCAQSVVAAFAEELQLDEKLALQFAVGFGGGMGRMQETCGAVTGACMVLGLYNGANTADNAVLKNSTYSMVQQFDRKFKALHHSTNCMELIQCDIKTAEGFARAKEQGIFESVCNKCIADAVQIVEELVGK